MCLVVGAPFLLKDLQAGRYEYRRVKAVSRELEDTSREKGIARRPREEVTAEKLHQEYMEKDYQDDYEIVRGPRPWEESDLGRGNRRVKEVVKSGASYGL